MKHPHWLHSVRDTPLLQLTQFAKFVVGACCHFVLRLYCMLKGVLVWRDAHAAWLHSDCAMLLQALKAMHTPT